jgi:hypothetical protein
VDKNVTDFRSSLLHTEGMKSFLKDCDVTDIESLLKRQLQCERSDNFTAHASLTFGDYAAYPATRVTALQRRQVFRLLRGLKQDGATSLLSKHRGKPSNHRLPAEVRTLALSIVRERYADFGPTLAAEKLAEHHSCSVSRETLRGWMIADGLWRDRRHRLPPPHQPRRRRDCLGELVQIDGSEHAWFEDRGAPCTLLAFVDDATSRLIPGCATAPRACFGRSMASA